MRSSSYNARGSLGSDPATGEVQEWPSPGGPDSQPYGIAAVGNLVLTCSGVKRMALVAVSSH